MHSWQWRNCEGFLYLSCSLLEKWPHGFFTRHFWPHSPQELADVLHPEAEVYRVKQVHGNTVLTPSEVRGQGLGVRGQEKAGMQGCRGAGENIDFNSPQLLSSSAPLRSQPTNEAQGNLAEADGLLTEQILQSVWVASADCTPVLIADSKTGQVAAVHAGWRGTAMKIVPQAIARLQAQGSQISDLRIALGPAIAGAVYQVSSQVAAQVGSSILLNQEAELVLDNLQQLPDSPLLPDSHPERVRLDIRRVIALQLEQLGFSSEQVAIAPYCTYQEPERFFSYRRDKLKKVQWSGIVSTNLC